MGEAPPELAGAGRELWAEAVAHLTATGRARRVFRHPLRMLCRLVGTLDDGDMGIQRIEAVRRWFRELGLTPTAAQGAEAAADGAPASGGGRARVLSLIGRKAAG
jgi:hypothetical protein